MPPLSNAKHEIVAQNVAIGKSWEESMILAEYSKVTARTQVHRLSSNVVIQSRIVELQEEAKNAILVDAVKLHRRWSEMFDADLADIMDSAGKYKPIQQWPKIWRQMLSECSSKDIFEPSQDGGGRSWDKIGEIVKLKWISVKELGELLGKHKLVDAFVAQKPDEKHLHIHLHAQVEDRLQKARQIAQSIESSS